MTKKKKETFSFHHFLKQYIFCVCPLVQKFYFLVKCYCSSVQMISYVLSLCMFQLQCNKKTFWLKALVFCSACSFRLCGRTVGWAFVQQNCFPPAERALVLEIACCSLEAAHKRLKHVFCIFWALNASDVLLVFFFVVLKVFWISCPCRLWLQGRFRNDNIKT